MVSMMDHFYSAGRSLEEILEDDGITPLERNYAVFHIVLDHDVRRALSATSLAAISFSDSAFVAFEQPGMAFPFAQCVMRHMLMCHVPVRIGMAYGSFKGLRFGVDTGPHINISSAQFLGSSIVRAHQAETCGYAGMRILLHPHLPVIRENTPLACAMDEVLPPDRQLKLSVTHELNYLDPPNDAIPRPVLPGENITPTPTTQGLFEAVNVMRESAPDDKKYQYDYTLHGMENMRKAYQHLSNEAESA
jgi:hypothetical protein